MTELPLYHLRSAASSQHLNELTLPKVERDLHGVSIPWPVTFALVLDPEYLSFMVSVGKKPQFDPSAQSGQYVEGLWTQDVAEFFLLDDDGHGYQEFNLSPSGAYWSMKFSSYRQREAAKLTAPEVEVSTDLMAQAWSGTLKVRRRSLSVAFSGSERSRANVCFHLEGRYISFASLVAPQPDFHLIEQYPYTRPVAI